MAHMHLETDVLLRLGDLCLHLMRGRMGAMMVGRMGGMIGGQDGGGKHLMGQDSGQDGVMPPHDGVEMGVGQGHLLGGTVRHRASASALATCMRCP